MQGRFQIFEAILERRRRGAWRWKVCSAEGDVIVRGLLLADVRLGTMPIERFSSCCFLPLPLEKAEPQ